MDARYRVVRNLHQRPQASNWTVSGGFGAGGAGTADIVSDGRFSGGRARRLTWSAAPSGGASLFISSGAQQVFDEGVNYLVMMRFGAVDFPYAITNAAFFSNRFANVRSRIDDMGDGTYVLREIRTRSGEIESLVLSQNGGTFIPPAVGAEFFAGNAAVFPIGTSTDLDLYDYVDGDQPNARWDGTPNASTSRGLVFVP